MQTQWQKYGVQWWLWPWRSARDKQTGKASWLVTYRPIWRTTIILSPLATVSINRWAGLRQFSSYVRQRIIQLIMPLVTNKVAKVFAWLPDSLQTKPNVLIADGLGTSRDHNTYTLCLHDSTIKASCIGYIKHLILTGTLLPLTSWDCLGLCIFFKYL